LISIVEFIGCSVPRLAWSYKVCRFSLCSTSKTRAYTRFVQNLARPCSWCC